MELDLNDKYVFKMADENHLLKEIRMPSSQISEKTSLSHVVCRSCGHDWPCEVRKEIEALKLKKMNESPIDFTY